MATGLPPAKESFARAYNFLISTIRVGEADEPAYLIHGEMVTPVSLSSTPQGLARLVSLRDRSNLLTKLKAAAE